MNHLSFWGWVITGMEGLANMVETLDKDDVPLTDEMHRRLTDAYLKIGAAIERADRRVENR